MATSVEPEDDTKASPDEKSKGGADLEFKIKANLPLQGRIDIKTEKEELAEIKGEVDLEFPNLPEANRRNIAERRLQERKAKRTKQTSAQNKNQIPRQNLGSAADQPEQKPPAGGKQPNLKAKVTPPQQKPPVGGGEPPQSRAATRGPRTPQPPKARVAQGAGSKVAGQAAKSVGRTVIVAIGEFIIATSPVWGTILLALLVAVVVLIALCKVPLAQTLLRLEYCKILNISEINVGSNTAGTGTASVSGASILALAQTKIGARENPDNTNSGPAINQFFFPGGRLGDPWCAYFASWIYGQAGATEVGNLQGRGGTFNLMGYFATRQRFLPPSDVFSGQATPQQGDMAFFARGTSGTEGHVGIVKSYNAATKELTTVDGNVNNSVAERTRDLDELEQCEGDDENRICQFLGLGRLK